MGLKNNKVAAIVCDFYAKQEKFKAVQKKFDAAKQDFYAAMQKEFDKSGESVLEFDTLQEVFTVKKVERVSVEFDAKKLKKKLTKAQAEKVISKRFIVEDADGFIAYLKECGCNTDILKDFLRTELSVDKKQLDKLYDTGDIDDSDVEGCYAVNKSKPYFTVSCEKK